MDNVTAFENHSRKDLVQIIIRLENKLVECAEFLRTYQSLLCKDCREIIADLSGKGE